MRVIVFLAIVTDMRAWAECPKSLPEWRRARDRFAAELSSPRASASDTFRIGLCLREGRGTFAFSESLQRCYAPIKQYLDYSDRSDQNKVTTPEYLRETLRYSTLPPDLNDQELLQAIGRGDVAAAEARLAKINDVRRRARQPLYTGVPFRSREDAIDDTKGKRFLISLPFAKKAPGEIAALYNFTLPDGVEGENPYQLSVVATRIDERGNPRSYFRDLERKTRRGDPHVTVDTPKNAPSTNNCIKCHTSGGPLAIRPKEVAPQYEKALAEINRGIREMGRSHSEHDPLAKQGATVGYGSRGPRGGKPSDAFLRRCAKDGAFPGQYEIRPSTRPVSVDLGRLRKAMNCGSCHDGEKRSVVDTDASKVVGHFVKFGGMPPGMELTREEREALLRCLGAELFGLVDTKEKKTASTEDAGTLYVSLTEGSCEPPPARRASPAPSRPRADAPPPRGTH